MKKPLLLYLTALFSIGYAYSDVPVADYSYYVEYIGFGSEVSFLNLSTGATSYFWDFGDGATSTDISPVHPYPEPGIFEVCLTATNAEGSDTFCETINTYYPPSADFAFSGDPTVNFLDLSVGFPDSWDWFFGDGAISDEENPEHTYAANGTYLVCLSATNPGGASYTCKDVVISSYPVTDAMFTYSGDPVTDFTDLSTEDPFAWDWDFGDGAISPLQNPEHIYLDNGVYTVCLHATNAGGTDSSCQDITITHAVAPPVAFYTYLAIGLDVAFVDGSSGAPASWSWDFGDGSTSTEQNPVHTFSMTDDDYFVCLTVENEGGMDIHCETISLTVDIGEYTLTPFGFQPNPADAYIEITNQISDWDLGMFTVYNMEGKIVHLPAEMVGKNLKLYLDIIPPGIYNLSYTFQGKRYIGLFVKN